MNNLKRQQLRNALERHVTKIPPFTVTARQRKVLEELPLEVFFSVPFLTHVFRLQYWQLGYLHASAPVIWHCAKARWPDVQILGDFVKKMPEGVSDLVEMSGFGHGALKLLADCLRVYGYPIKYKPELENRPENAEEKAAREAITRLALA